MKQLMVRAFHVVGLIYVVYSIQGGCTLPVLVPAMGPAEPGLCSTFARLASAGARR